MMNDNLNENFSIPNKHEDDYKTQLTEENEENPKYKEDSAHQTNIFQNDVQTEIKHNNFPLDYYNLEEYKKGEDYMEKNKYEEDIDNKGNQMNKPDMETFGSINHHEKIEENKIQNGDTNTSENINYNKENTDINLINIKENKNTEEKTNFDDNKNLNLLKKKLTHNEDDLIDDLLTYNNNDGEKNTSFSIKKKNENLNEKNISSKINSELSILDLRKKNSEIKSKFEKLSMNSQKKQSNLNIRKKQNKTSFHNNTNNTVNLPQKKIYEEEIMIQRIVIQQSDTDDIVQKKVHTIENDIEEAEKKNINTLAQNKDIHKNPSFYHSENSKDISVKLERHEENNSSVSDLQKQYPVKCLTSFKESEISENTKNTMDNKINELHSYTEGNYNETKVLNDDIVIQNYSTQINEEIHTKDIKDDQIKDDILINNKILNEKNTKNNNSKMSEDLMNIKIYDDSEIDETKENELEPFWLNKEISTSFNTLKTNINDKLLNVKNQNQIMWTREDYKDGLFVLDRDNLLNMKKSESVNITNREKIKNNISQLFKKSMTLDTINRNSNGKEVTSVTPTLNYDHSPQRAKSFKNLNFYEGLAGESSCDSCTTQSTDDEKEKIDIKKKIKIIKQKLLHNNNDITNIENIKVDNFDIYNIDFKKIGLNTSNLNTEEKYILMLYISEQQMKLALQETKQSLNGYINSQTIDTNRGGNNDAYTLSENESKVTDLENIRWRANYLGRNEKYADNFKLNMIRLKNNSIPFYDQNMGNKINENKNNKYPLSDLNTSYYTYNFSQYKLNDDDKVYSIAENKSVRNSYIENELLKLHDPNYKEHPHFSFFQKLYIEFLINEYKIKEKDNTIILDDNTICRKNYDIYDHSFMDNLLKSFVEIFIQDEGVDELLSIYEDTIWDREKGIEEAKIDACAEYICRMFLENSSNKNIAKRKYYNNEQNIFSTQFYTLLKYIANKIVINGNIINKVKEIQILNKILNDEVKIYCINVVCMEDLFLDVEPHFIDEFDKVIIGKNVGFFNMHVINSEYKYNYYINENDLNALNNDQNNSSVWNYVYGYFNDIYNWYNEKNEHKSNQIQNKDSIDTKDSINVKDKDASNSSKTLSRNYIKNANKLQSSRNNIIFKNEKLDDQDNKYKTLEKKKTEEFNANLKNEESQLTPNSEHIYDKNNDSSKKEKKKKKKKVEEKEFPKNVEIESSNNLIEKKTSIQNKNEEHDMLSNSTNIDEYLMDSNMSSINNYISENSNKIKIQSTSNLINTNSLNNNPDEKPMNEQTKINNNNYTDDIHNKYPNDSVEIENPNLIKAEEKNIPRKLNINFKQTNHEDLKKENQFIKMSNNKFEKNQTSLVAFQYKGTLPKGDINKLLLDKNSNIKGNYFCISDDKLIVTHSKNGKIENFLDSHFVIEKCMKYNKEINHLYVHIFNLKNKKYLAVDLESNIIVFTSKYDDQFYYDQNNTRHRISTYFHLQSIADIMKKMITDDIIHIISNIVLSSY
ncbi:hypothetical protein YYG_00189 [Plasmodium vinckei petteri]|uniref:Uncharacterized protein n=1 Tax=Plasmodium vinckei petteri TaxID=138298 RepID=W7AL78_PLAVN|nr:hypothetical protein YYG_00189 [Plasmodium vinckei petteri]CAD2113350.1 conserved Plasmodium protein, unknown function [Plasmodium vinckei petteri]